MMLVGASGLGWESNVASARASLMVVKAMVASAVHVTPLLLCLADESSALRKIADGSDLFLQWTDAVTVHTMA